MYNRQYIVLTKGVSSVNIKQKRTAETNKVLQDKKRARWQVGEVEVEKNRVQDEDRVQAVAGKETAQKGRRCVSVHKMRVTNCATCIVLPSPTLRWTVL